MGILQFLQALLLLFQQCGQWHAFGRLHTVMSIHVRVTIMTSRPLHQYLQYLIAFSDMRSSLTPIKNSDAPFGPLPCQDSFYVPDTNVSPALRGPVILQCLH